jgi:hypothetical protein
LELPEIEAIVAEIEREKEAGMCSEYWLQMLKMVNCCIQRPRGNGPGWRRLQLVRQQWQPGQISLLDSNRVLYVLAQFHLHPSL